MSVHLGPLPVGAFLAIVLTVMVIIGTVIARRRGHFQSRAGLIAVAVLVALLVAYAMTAASSPEPEED